jgi:hypothetical protein
MVDAGGRRISSQAAWRRVYAPAGPGQARLRACARYCTGASCCCRARVPACKPLCQAAEGGRAAAANACLLAVGAGARRPPAKPKRTKKDQSKENPTKPKFSLHRFLLHSKNFNFPPGAVDPKYWSFEQT